MKYGIYLTINGGEETILVGLYQQKKKAVEALEKLSLDEEKIQMQAKGKKVTCLEILDQSNFTTVKYIPHV